MKWLIALLLTCSSVLGQGFGSFTYDQPFLSASATMFTPYLSSGLIAYWKLDEVTTNGVFLPKFHDSSDPYFDFWNALTKRTANAPVTQPGIITNSILIDGSVSTGAECPDNQFVSWHSNLTITCWVYQTNVGPDSFILDKNNASTDFEYAISTSGSSAVLRVWPSGGVRSVTATAPTMPLNNWLFVCGQVDYGSHLIRIKTATTASIGDWFTNTWTGTPTDGPGTFKIGGNSVIDSFRGRVDEVTMWTNLISDQVVTNIWNRMFPFN